MEIPDTFASIQTDTAGRGSPETVSWAVPTSFALLALNSMPCTHPELRLYRNLYDSRSALAKNTVGLGDLLKRKRVG